MSSIVASYAPATWSRYPPLLTGARYRAYFAADFRAGAITRAYFANVPLQREPTGELVPFVIGKPSHAEGLHPGARISQRFDRTQWHCPEPCGATFTRLKDAKRHTARLVATSYHKVLCPITVANVAAAAAAKRKAHFASMSSEELAAYIERLKQARA